MAGSMASDLAERAAALPASARRPPWRTLAVVAVWCVAFAVTRLLPLALTFDPALYGPEISDPTGDVSRYAGWAEQIVGDGLAAYRDVDVEYPPGALPFVILPALLGQAQFSLTVFVALMVLLDAVGFTVLLVLARRGASRRGVVTWLIGPPLLGVLLYARLDLIPAVALLLALERAYARHWFSSGVWFGLGAAAKLFPALFLPLALLAAGERRVRLVSGAVLGGLVSWVPFAGDTGDLLSDVLGYHSARGIHLESLWGSLLNLERIAGGPVELVFEFGAFHITGPGDAAMLRWTTVLSVAIVGLSVLIAGLRWWRHPERAHLELPLAVTATLALLVGTGRVFSPQFVVWLLAAAAVLFAVLPRVALWAGPLLLVIVVLTAAGYPLGFDLLRDGARSPALVLVYRNAAVIALGVGLVVHWLLGVGPPVGERPAARTDGA